MKTGIIHLENIQLYGHHGCLKEETVIGSKYRVDVWIYTDLSISAKSDKIEDTINYVTVHEIIAQEMKIPSHLLEHLAKRIVENLEKKFQSIQKIKLKVTKISPPINGNVEKVSVILKT